MRQSSESASSWRMNVCSKDATRSAPKACRTGNSARKTRSCAHSRSPVANGRVSVESPGNSTGAPRRLTTVSPPRIPMDAAST